MKLLRVERSLQIFPKKGEELVAEFPLNLELDIITTIVKPLKQDPLLYRPYALRRIQIRKLLALMNLELMLELKAYHYFLDCSGIYDFENK